MSQLPAYLQQHKVPDLNASLSATLGSGMPPHVSIAGGRFTLVDAANNELPGAWFDQKIGVYIDACIMDTNPVKSRIYYAGAFDSDAEGVRPDCFSDNGIGPSISAGSPQGPSCMPDPTGVNGCKWAVWGSKINANGKKVPACSEKQKVALLIPGYTTLFLLAIPPKSHNWLREYINKCKDNNINIADVITRISFVPGVQGELQFQGVNYIDEPTAVLRQQAYLEKKTDDLVGRNDTPRPAGMLAAPVQQVQQPVQTAPVQQIAQQVQQPGPFGQGNPAQVAGPQLGMQTTPQDSPLFPNPSATSTTQTTAAPAGTAATASPSEAAPATRKRHRSAAEMQAANGAAPNGQGAQAGSAAPQAPFPHAGQPAAAQQPSQATFGIAQAQEAGAEVQGMLDDFFKG